MKRMIKNDSRLKMFVKKEKKEPRNFIMDVLIVIAMLFLFVQIGRFASEYQDAFSDYTPSVSSMSYNYMEKDYGAIVRYYLQSPNMKKKKEYKEYCALAEYYLTGVLYQSRKVNGDTESMNAQMERMQEAKMNMGSLQKASKDIDKILLIEE